MSFFTECTTIVRYVYCIIMAVFVPLAECVNV